MIEVKKEHVVVLKKEEANGVLMAKLVHLHNEYWCIIEMFEWKSGHVSGLNCMVGRLDELNLDKYGITADEVVKAIEEKKRSEKRRQRKKKGLNTGK